jgi:hypothetical protein
VLPQRTPESRWAVVNADGSPERGKGVVASSLFSLGAFEKMIFTKKVANCADVATIGNAAAGNPSHGTIVVGTPRHHDNGVSSRRVTSPGRLPTFPST